MIYEYLKNIDFAYPLAFALFALLPLLVWWYMKRNDRREPVITVTTIHAFRVSSWKNKLRGLPVFFRLLSMSALILVLARPQKKNEEQRTEGEGIDIVLCMDVSGSMGSRDIAPSRMEAAKEVAEEFVRGRPVDRIGLVIFSGESFTQCPITTDRNALISQIQNLESRKHLADGTAPRRGAPARPSGRARARTALDPHDPAVRTSTRSSRPRSPWRPRRAARGRPGR